MTFARGGGNPDKPKAVVLDRRDDPPHMGPVPQHVGGVVVGRLGHPTGKRSQIILGARREVPAMRVVHVPVAVVISRLNGWVGLPVTVISDIPGWVGRVRPDIGG